MARLNQRGKTLNSIEMPLGPPELSKADKIEKEAENIVEVNRTAFQAA